MDNSKLSTRISEIIDSAETAMSASGVVDAIRDTLIHYPHNSTELIILNALLDRLEEINTNTSAIWWKAIEIDKELKKIAVSAEPVTDTKEDDNAIDDIPFK